MGIKAEGLILDTTQLQSSSGALKTKASLTCFDQSRKKVVSGGAALTWSLSEGAVLEINPANANTTVTITDNRILASGSYIDEINVATIVFKQDATGGRTLTLAGGIVDTPTVRTDANAVTVLVYFRQTSGGGVSDWVLQTSTTGNMYSKTATTYTLALSDVGHTIESDNTTTFTLTVPTNASVAFTVGDEIRLRRAGTGTFTVSPAGGVTIQSKSSAVTLAARYSWGVLRKIATNTWWLYGDLA